MYRRDMWANERNRRDFNNPLSFDLEYQTHHRRCPVCEGEGAVQTHPGTYYDQPEYDTCPACDGLGRVNQAEWERAQVYLEDARIAPDGPSEYDEED